MQNNNNHIDTRALYPTRRHLCIDDKIDHLISILDYLNIGDKNYLNELDAMIEDEDIPRQQIVRQILTLFSEIMRMSPTNRKKHMFYAMIGNANTLIELDNFMQMMDDTLYRLKDIQSTLLAEPLTYKTINPIHKLIHELEAMKKRSQMLHTEIFSEIRQNTMSKKTLRNLRSGPLQELKALPPLPSDDKPTFPGGTDYHLAKKRFKRFQMNEALSQLNSTQRSG